MEQLKDALEFSADQERRAIVPQEHPKGGKFVVIGSDQKIEHIEAPARVLDHVVQMPQLLDQASFVDYFNRFKTPSSRIFADVRKPMVMGVIDYHAPTDKATSPKPDYTDHRVAFSPPWSEQWRRWRDIDGKSMSQANFAEFLEENYLDIVKPTSAEMMDVVTNLEARKNVSFVSGVRLHDGSNQLTYSEEVETKGKGSLRIPTEFEIAAPVFYGGTVYSVRVLLRYRINEGKLVFAVKLNRREFIEQTAFSAITDFIAEKTEVSVYQGSL